MKKIIVLFIVSLSVYAESATHIVCELDLGDVTVSQVFAINLADKSIVEVAQSLPEELHEDFKELGLSEGAISSVKKSSRDIIYNITKSNEHVIEAVSADDLSEGQLRLNRLVGTVDKFYKLTKSDIDRSTKFTNCRMQQALF